MGQHLSLKRRRIPPSKSTDNAVGTSQETSTMTPLKTTTTNTTKITEKRVLQESTKHNQPPKMVFYLNF